MSAGFLSSALPAVQAAPLPLSVPAASLALPSLAPPAWSATSLVPLATQPTRPNASPVLPDSTFTQVYVYPALTRSAWTVQTTTNTASNVSPATPPSRVSARHVPKTVCNATPREPITAILVCAPWDSRGYEQIHALNAFLAVHSASRPTLPLVSAARPAPSWPSTTTAFSVQQDAPPALMDPPAPAVHRGTN